jgi:hypothetical protein
MDGAIMYSVTLSGTEAEINAIDVVRTLLHGNVTATSYLPRASATINVTLDGAEYHVVVDGTTHVLTVNTTLYGSGAVVRNTVSAVILLLGCVFAIAACCLSPSTSLYICNCFPVVRHLSEGDVAILLCTPPGPSQPLLCCLCLLFRCRSTVPLVGMETLCTKRPLPAPAFAAMVTSVMPAA